MFLIYDARLSTNDPSHLSKENFHTWISTLLHLHSEIFFLRRSIQSKKWPQLCSPLKIHFCQKSKYFYRNNSYCTFLLYQYFLPTLKLTYKNIYIIIFSKSFHKFRYCHYHISLTNI